ncbi:MAG: sodium:proton antiporter [Phycisphaerales bacterium]|nr:sodium:proton antiporter [Phycisphaerales bacterium]
MAAEHAQPAPHEAGAADAVAVASHEVHGPSPVIPLWLVLPFVLLLASIALMPFINEKAWHAHYPDFAFLLGGIVIAYYFVAFGKAGYLPGESYGQHKMVHTALEYYSFIALIGGLFVASGGVLVDVRGRGGPIVNTGLLAVGAVMANIMGTTGASVLLIRPFLRINKGRLHPMHVVLFIFIISNCGGALTPIGDPPLYLGFLKGVPFEWTIIHLWPAWAATIGMLLAVYFVTDTLIARKHPFQTDDAAPAAPTRVRLRGASGMISLALIVAGVFIDPMLKKYAGIEGYPIGPTFQVAVACVAYAVANRDILKANDFNFGPVKEVGLLFIGIFATMAPALGFLAAHGHSLGLSTPSAFYFGTGSLSAVLDNAPTYLNFLQVSFGEGDINHESVVAYLASDLNRHELIAISLGAVFFGAMTYIGNGPNFMVRAIAEASGLKMPSFFGYLLRSVVILLPILVITWAIFVRG